MSHFIIHGAVASPYSVKVRAALRYLRLPYVWNTNGDALTKALNQVKVPVIPVIQRPDGSWTNDSTPFLQELDAANPARALLPQRPDLRMAALLIEDMADEILTKPMFNERWIRPADAEVASRWLAFDRSPGLGRDALETNAGMIKTRQIGRMPIVGCTPENQAAINYFRDDMYALLNELALEGPFLFGSRPSVAEFAIYGQMSQLAADPTSGEVLSRNYPYAYRWIGYIDDAGGVEGDWADDALDIDVTRRFLELVGEIHLPFLTDNAAAVDAGDEEMSTTLYGEPYRGAAFKYQAKCLHVLKHAWAGLGDADKTRLADAIGKNAALLD
ncbi:MAG: glutathione S-transferase family protein [Pseudomonadota bacterium]